MSTATDATGQGIRLQEITEHLHELSALYHRKKDAAETFSAGVEAIAIKAGVSKKALSAFVTAKANDKVADVHSDSEQLSLMCSECDNQGKLQIV